MILNSGERLREQSERCKANLCRAKNEVDSNFRRRGCQGTRRAEELFRGFCGCFEALQFLSGFEAHGLAWGNVDFFTGTRVAADAGLARLDAEYAEAAELDTLPFAQCGLQGFEYSFDGLLCLGATDIRRSGVHHGVHDVQLNHTNLQLYPLADARGYVAGCQDVTGNLHWLDFYSGRSGRRGQK